MSDILQLEQALRKQLNALLTAFNEILKKHNLLGLELDEIRFELRDGQMDNKKVGILKELNKILANNGLAGIFASSFTLSERSTPEVLALYDVTVENGRLIVRRRHG